MRTSAALGITVQGVTFKCRSAMATDLGCRVGGSWELVGRDWLLFSTDPCALRDIGFIM